MQKLTTPLLNETVVRSEVHELPLCQKKISDNGKVLLLENVAPSRSDKVPGQRHPHDVMGNGLDGGDGILLADLVRVKSVVQVSGSGKKAKHCHCLITQAKHSSPRLCDKVRLT